MALPTEMDSVNKTIHLTGIGLAVQAFYINLTLDSMLGKEYLQLAPVGPISINPTSVWKINGRPLDRVTGKSSADRRGEERPGLTSSKRGGYEVDEPENGLTDSIGRQKVHKTTGVRTKFRKDESGDKVTHNPDNDDEDNEEVVADRHESSFSDGKGWFDDMGERKDENNPGEVVVSREIVPIIPRRRF